MDTRPYRLNWPRSSVIYDISPEEVFKHASEKLKGAGAKISKGSMLFHVPLESSDIPSDLCKKGFSGNRPSLWILQGLPLASVSTFESILSIVSSLAMEGCIFLGELPDLLPEDKPGNTHTKHELEKLFMRHGFQVGLSDYSEMVRKLQLDLPPGDCRLFTSRQLRLSDAQTETWREHFGRLEEEADEEGFEEM